MLGLGLGLGLAVQYRYVSYDLVMIYLPVNSSFYWHAKMHMGLTYDLPDERERADTDRAGGRRPLAKAETQARRKTHPAAARPEATRTTTAAMIPINGIPSRVSVSPFLRVAVGAADGTSEGCGVGAAVGTAVGVMSTCVTPLTVTGQPVALW